MPSFDAIVIGTGQAGPPLAARLAQDGRKVAIVERKLFGGTCVNTGCTPTKAMVASARAADFGVRVEGGVRVDMRKVKARKDSIVSDSNSGIQDWLESLDDVTVYRVADDVLFLCVNAANVEKDYRWCVRHAGPDTEVRDRSAETALLALQGPAAERALAPLAEAELGALKRFRFLETKVAGHPVLVSRTGYTGSDGFELYAPREAAQPLWEALLAGKDAEVAPAGLGARDTLRLEAALPLYGHELDDATSPLEAGLDRFVKLERGGFLGAEALQRQAEAGLARRLVGFEVEGRGIAREGYPLLHDGDEVGVVTSGAPSPTLGKSIGLGYVPPPHARTGAELEVAIRSRRVAARVVEPPFVRAR